MHVYIYIWKLKDIHQTDKQKKKFRIYVPLRVINIDATRLLFKGGTEAAAGNFSCALKKKKKKGLKNEWQKEADGKKYMTQQKKRILM